MYTQSNAYVRKSSSMTLLALLLFSAMILLIPIGIANGSTGHPLLGTVTTAATLSGWAPATNTVNVIAGSSAASNDAGMTFANHFAICFSGCAGASTVFSGSQFYLYLSEDGLSEISPSDIRIAGLFSVSALASTTITTSTEANGTYYLGTVGGDELLSGPLPVKLSAEYIYIKIYDGSTTSVAVSSQTVSINPGLTVTPTSGPASTEVTISGGGFPSTAKIAINYTYTYYNWAGTESTKTGTWISSGITNNNGWFTKTTPIADVKQVYNPGGEVGVQPSTPITLSAVNASKLSHAFTPTAGNAIFTETNRVFKQVVSYFPTGGVATFVAKGTYGNDSNGVGSLLTNPIEVYYSGGLGIEGNYTAVGTTVTVSIGGTNLGSVTSNPTTGQYVVNVTLPSLTVGTHIVTVSNNGVTYQFTIYMNPTLILKPSSGPALTTTTEAYAYGFPTAGSGFNGKVSIYWYEYSWGTPVNYFLVNGTVGSNGEFNNTGGFVKFVAPLSYGGVHDVTASKFYYGKTTGSITGSNLITVATFTITPTLEICVTSTTCGSGSTNANTVSVKANTRTILNATGTGFGFTCGADCWDGDYQVNIDNAMYSDFSTYASNNGFLYVNFTAAGFAPGLHQVELYGCYTDVCVGAPAAVAYFNVTGITSSSGGIPSSTISQINTIYNNVNTILGWGTYITGTYNNVNTILGWGTTITTINTNVGTINTNVGTILGWQSTIISINSTVNGLKTTLAAMQTTLGTVATDLGTTTLASVYSAAQAASAAASAASTAATNAKSSVSDTETYVLVVAVLVAITLVLELAVLVRKLD